MYTTIGILVIGILIEEINIKRSMLIQFLIVMILLILTCSEGIAIPRASRNEKIEKEDEIAKIFFEEVENKLGENAKVYVLPELKLPIYNNKNDMNMYETFKGYLYTDSIMWSTGAVKGYGNEDSALYVDNGKSETFVRNILDSGYKAVYVDTRAYSGRSVINFYENEMGIEPYISQDGIMYLFILE